MIHSLLLLAALLWIPGLAAAGSAELVVDGKRRVAAVEYRVGRVSYISARDAASIYGAQLYWFPVAGRLKLSMRGRQLELLVGSDTAVIDGKKVPLSGQVILRGSEAFVPAGLLVSREFASWAGQRTEWGGGAQTTSAAAPASVGPLRWSTRDGFTRVVLELGPGLARREAERDGQELIILIPKGRLSAPRKERVDDGRVTVAALSQGADAVRFSIGLASADLQWKLEDLSGPRRVVIDVSAGGAPPAAFPAVSTGTVSSVPSSTAAADSTAAGAAPSLAGRPPSRAASEEALPAGAAAVGGSARSEGKFRIVIDAGHGGKDSGAIGRKGSLEKDVVLALASALARRLRDEGDFDVLSTRDGDYFVPLSERSRAANDFKADLFVSVHCNASRRRSDAGFETYFLSEKASDPEAERLAEFENSVVELEGKSVEEEEANIILRAMTRVEFINESARFAGMVTRLMGKRLEVANRGVKQAAFYVLRWTDAPAVLFETAYLTNKKDESRLGTTAFRKKVVDGLYQSIIEYARGKAEVGR